MDTRVIITRNKYSGRVKYSDVKKVTQQRKRERERERTKRETIWRGEERKKTSTDLNKNKQTKKIELTRWSIDAVNPMKERTRNSLANCLNDGTCQWVGLLSSSLYCYPFFLFIVFCFSIGRKKETRNNNNNKRRGFNYWCPRWQPTEPWADDGDWRKKKKTALQKMFQNCAVG